MEEYIYNFNSEAEYNTARSTNYKEPWVSVTNIGGGGSSASYRVNYNKSEEEKILGTPLTFEITSNGNIVWKANYGNYAVTLEYSKNGGEWSGIKSTTGGTSISVSAGDTVQFRCGTDDGYATMSSGYSRYNTFSGTTAGFKIKGNVMSLLNRNFASLDTLQSGYTFFYLFQYCTGLTDASKLVLPATNLALDCYGDMFYYCTSLTTAPSTLPATTLANYCCTGMFVGCTSLTTAPELPATTLASGCYYDMFQNCTSLTTAPSILPATNLAERCYYYMFNGCTSLTTAPELPATTLASECFTYMFKNCTSLTAAPELPATTLAVACYDSMFQDCTNLNYIKCLATDISAFSCTNNWVNGVASTGTFVKNDSMTSWTTGTSGIPTGWTVQDA